MSLDLTEDTPTLVIDAVDTCRACKRPGGLAPRVSPALQLTAEFPFHSDRLSLAQGRKITALRQMQDAGYRNGLLLSVSDELSPTPFKRNGALTFSATAESVN